ncbi:hypothetical protein GCM10009557_29470 [Virgisporangium ochraceum]|uniref:Uncharacterized protein n=1 Tax=Virgisporangium ochraceum TaxID=65505 RepID=A0A8J4EHU6_9ACTN|nr:hypothetical protein [Virgisporangium ochraceum]GIJ75103.1 hypothetical protein Voc01_100200 [Virgisporangium ochraceum]
MTTETTAVPTATVPGSEVETPTAAGGISRLNAFDGLFLRAEHLIAMQDYARDLALAVGCGGGPGVVSGFTVTHGTEYLDISPGLAVDPAGRPLRSHDVIRLPLTGTFVPALDANGFWWIEILLGTWQYGDADVTGSLCDEPCGGGTSKRLYKAEGVHARLSSATRPGFDLQPPEQRRNWLARELFGVEETAGGRQTLTGASALLTRNTWLPAVPETSSGEQPVVRLGVLIPGRSKMRDEVDTWIARRDRGAAPPERDWRWRLGMRPWDVFIAQILQFQEQLADRHDTPAQAAERKLLIEFAELIREAGSKAAGREQTKLMTRTRLDQLADDFTAHAVAASGPAGTLVGLGFTDLPPAGFLPYPNGNVAGVAAWLQKLLPPMISPMVCPCRLSDVGQAIEQAQHRDRVPLTGSTDRKTDVRVLVPVDETGRVAVGWVAFARRDQVVCPEPAESVDEVGVFIVEYAKDTYDEDIKSLTTGVLPTRYTGKGQPDGVENWLVRYPVRAWRLPTDADYLGRYTALRNRVKSPADLRIFVLSRADSESPLGLLRATLLTDPFAAAPRLGTIEAHEDKNIERQSIVIAFGPDVPPGPRL